MGKTTLCDRLLDEFAQTLIRVITTTSRKPRPHEIDGVDYFFLSTDEFSRRTKSGDFLEYELIHGNFYGTLRESLFNEKELKNQILNIDVNGARAIQAKVHESFGDSVKVLSIFIKPKSLKQLRERLIHRGTDHESEIEKRLDTAQDELKMMDFFDVIIETDTKEADYQAIRAEYLSFTGN